MSKSQIATLNAKLNVDHKNALATAANPKVLRVEQWRWLTAARIVMAFGRIAIAAALTATACTVRAAEIQVEPAGLAYVRQQKLPLPGKHIKSIVVNDKNGLHLLVMTQLTGPSHTDRGSGRDERTDLHAIYYARTGEAWVQEWAIRDYSDCPGLDHSADFLPDAVTVTDVDNNGMAEVTVAYTLFCGGGVDSSDLKVIMREGSKKFAMRGRTITNYPEAPDGGEATYDKSLSLPVNAAFRKQIAAVRQKVVIEKH